MKVLVLAMAVALLGAAPAPAQVAWVPGGPNTSCATWLSNPSQFAYGRGFILGVWTGLNMKNPKSGRVGFSTDGAGIVAEVKLVCEAEPSVDLLVATMTVYNRFEKELR